MLASRKQLAEICIALTRRCDDLPLWELQGPTARARALREAGHFGLPATQRTLCQLAWTLWEGGREPSFQQVIELLDRTYLREVGTLLVALADGPQAVDRWLRANGAPHGDA